MLLFFSPCKTVITTSHEVVGCAYGCTPIFKDNNLSTGDIVDCNGTPYYPSVKSCTIWGDFNKLVEKCPFKKPKVLGKVFIGGLKHGKNG